MALYGVRQMTLSYIQSGSRLLLMERNHQPLKGYWLPPGGHVEKNEDAYVAAIHEVKEESGLTIKSMRCKAMITLATSTNENALLYAFWSDDFEGTPVSSAEGTLRWIEIDDIPTLRIPNSDAYIFPLIRDHAGHEPLFIKCQLDGDDVMEVMVNGVGRII
ncbi:NUDIX hydrolase [Alicyclobacillus fodiniaquatilis]|uniref:NUDIX domain-containing protein n=1 Tax=Alicyclobacillus fodiniaquatilis TaxID=1661150 RepID=A0ABW4JGV6_9BACL